MVRKWIWIAIAFVVFLAGSASSATLINLASQVQGILACTHLPALTGDATTSQGSCSTTVVKVDGVAYSASPSTDTVPIITASNTATYSAIPNCTDTGGNHLNYTTSTHALSCGSTGGGGGGLAPFFGTGAKRWAGVWRNGISTQTPLNDTDTSSGVSFTSPTTTVPPAISTNGGTAFLDGAPQWLAGKNLDFATRGFNDATASERRWFGVADSSFTNFSGADNGSGSFAAFRYRNTISSKWDCVTSDGTGTTATDSGVTVDTGYHTFEILFTGNVTNVKFYIDSSLVCTNTTNLPLNTSVYRRGFASATGSGGSWQENWFFIQADPTWP
jgi:hypothetical protein